MITRPAGDSDHAAALLRARRLAPVTAPLLRIAPLALGAHGPVHAVLITSGNALPALQGMLHTPLLAVGDATARRARDAGFLTVASARGDATDLLRLTQSSHAPGASLLLATGRGQGDALAAGLRAAGFRVHRRVVYAASPVLRMPEAATESLTSGRARAVVFLSADTARAFAKLIPRRMHATLAGVDALAIGHGAGDILSLLPWRQVRVSVGPTLEQVLALL